MSAARARQPSTQQSRPTVSTRRPGETVLVGGAAGHVGRAATVLALDLLAPGGRVIVMAGLDQRPELPVGALYTRDARILGFAISNARTDELEEAARRINQLMTEGRCRRARSASCPLPRRQRPTDDSRRAGREVSGSYYARDDLTDCPTNSVVARGVKLLDPLLSDLTPHHLAVYWQYQVVRTIVDFGAAACFVVGSAFFFFASLALEADWLFLVGSVLFALKPTIDVVRSMHLNRLPGQGDGPAQRPPANAT